MLKRVLALALASAITFSLSACSSNGSNQPSDGSSLAKITVVLDWTPNTNHTGLFAAKELGYYSELGLDVEIVQPPEGGADALVASGRAQFGVGFQDSLAPAFSSNNPLPVTAVAALIQHNTSGLISLKENGIDSPAKLAGKTYATWDSPVEKAMIRTIVSEDGGDFESINMIPSTVTDVITALNTDIDSVWIFYAWDGIATEVRGLETNYLDFAEINPVFDYYTPVLIAGNEYLAKSPEEAKKFLEATAKGYEFAIENPDAAAEILLKSAPELDRDIVLASQKWLADKYKAEVERWGYIDPVRWDAFYNWLGENNLLEKPLAPGAGFSNEYLPQ